MKINAYFAAAVAVALAGLSLPTAQAAAASDAYNFEIVGKPTRTADGTTITVHLSRPTGEPVTNAQMVYSAPLQPNPKASFVVRQRITMQPDGLGNYMVVLHGPISRGTPVRFVATVPVLRAAAQPVAAGAADGPASETIEWSTRLK